MTAAELIIWGSEIDVSRHGDTAALGCQDCVTKWIGAYPAPRKTAEESMRALQHIAGEEKVALLYTDGSGELEKASLFPLESHMMSLHLIVHKTMV